MKVSQFCNLKGKKFKKIFTIVNQFTKNDYIASDLKNYRY